MCTLFSSRKWSQMQKKSQFFLFLKFLYFVIHHTNNLCMNFQINSIRIEREKTEFMLVINIFIERRRYIFSFCLKKIFCFQDFFFYFGDSKVHLHLWINKNSQKSKHYVVILRSDSSWCASQRSCHLSNKQ